MMDWWTIVGIILLAAVLFFLELILPGGVMGFIGGVLLLLATFLAYEGHGGMAAALVFTGGILFVTFFFYFQFRLFPNTRLGQKLFLNTSNQGTSNEEYEDSLVGAQGETLSKLVPSGAVKVNGRRYEAICKSGYLEAGVPVEVVSRDAFRLVVRKAQDES